MPPTAKRNGRQSRAQRLLNLIEMEQSDAVPTNMDELRTMLARRAAMLADRWGGCREPACRRHRHCTAPHIRCSNARVLGPIAPKKRAAVLARLQRDLRQAIARNEAWE